MSRYNLAIYVLIIIIELYSIVATCICMHHMHVGSHIAIICSYNMYSCIATYIQLQGDRYTFTEWLLMFNCLVHS